MRYWQIGRFLIEAQSAGQLNHPNIVPIYSVGQEDGVHCYSMPLIDGRRTTARRRRRKNASQRFGS